MRPRETLQQGWLPPVCAAAPSDSDPRRYRRFLLAAAPQEAPSTCQTPLPAKIRGRPAGELQRSSLTTRVAGGAMRSWRQAPRRVQARRGHSIAGPQARHDGTHSSPPGRLKAIRPEDATGIAVCPGGLPGTPLRDSSGLLGHATAGFSSAAPLKKAAHAQDRPFVSPAHPASPRSRVRPQGHPSRS